MFEYLILNISFLKYSFLHHKNDFYFIFMINYNKRMSNNLQNFKAFIIQALVQNYIEKENKNSNIYVYNEIINDIDIFNQCLKNIKRFEENTNLYKENIHIFIENLPLDSYIQSIDVKHCTYENFKFKYLIDLISQIKYPQNTQLQLILVPNDIKDDIDESMIFNISKFNKIKNIFIELCNQSEFIKKILFTELYKNNLLKKGTITESLICIINKYENNKLIDIDESIDFDLLYNNFQNISVRIITLNELYNCEIDKNFFKHLLEEI